MNRMLRSGAAAGFLLLLITGASADASPVRSGNAVFDKAVEMVNQYFHDPAALPKFNAAVAGEVAKGVSDPNAAIADVLPALGASHMGHYTRDELAYYELADIFRFNFRKDLARLFPPQGRISYPGIGIATEVIGGKRFVTDVYDGAPTAVTSFISTIVKVGGFLAFIRLFHISFGAEAVSARWLIVLALITAATLVVIASWRVMVPLPSVARLPLAPSRLPGRMLLGGSSVEPRKLVMAELSESVRERCVSLAQLAWSLMLMVTVSTSPTCAAR